MSGTRRRREVHSSMSQREKSTRRSSNNYESQSNESSASDNKRSKMSSSFAQTLDAAVQEQNKAKEESKDFVVHSLPVVLSETERESYLGRLKASPPVERKLSHAVGCRF